MHVVEEKTLISRGWKYKQLRLEQEKKHKQLSFLKEGDIDGEKRRKTI